jgi:UDP-N-acetylglucosamine/UDP-N-acetyl-alpha-D-glucosaminouronate 4-epimerase
MSNISILSGKACLVTGGAGFIGSHLVDGLLDAGASVRVLDNFATGHEKNLAHVRDRIELIEGDIRDLPTCQKAADGVTYVFHQAALGSVPRSVKDPATSLAVNVVGTANVFTAARDAGVARVVYASSSSVYGDNEELPKREGREGSPLSPYAASKWMDEELADTYARVYGMSFVGLRYFNVYGPRQDPNGAYAAVIPKFFAACMKGEAPTIYGDGQQSRDFTFVADVVRANMLAGIADTEGAIALNIGAGSTTTVTELAEAIIAITGASVKPSYGDPRAGDVRYSRADFSRARGSIGWSATMALGDGLAKTKPA